MSQPISTDRAPTTDQNTDDHSNPWGGLRRPGDAAPTREGTPAPAPAPVAQVVERGPPWRLRSEFCAGAFGGAEEAALVLDSDEASRDRLHPPPLPRRSVVLELIIFNTE